jgi:hypothetical protein
LPGAALTGWCRSPSARAGLTLSGVHAITTVAEVEPATPIERQAARAHTRRTLIQQQLSFASPLVGRCHAW